MRVLFTVVLTSLVVAPIAWPAREEFRLQPGTNPSCSHVPEARAARARANDNTQPSGKIHADTLRVSLVAVTASWYPESDTGCALQVLAFKLEGGEASVPGPLLRVRSGTPMHVTVRNDAARTLWLRGLNDHPSTQRQGVRLVPNATHEFRFTATTPGTYAYVGTLFPAMGPTVRVGARDDGQLLGAFVVDEASAPGQPRDRVLVITRWSLRDVIDSLPPQQPAPRLHHFINAVNGKSWPHNEMLDYAEGDSIHWRVLNANTAGHPMHLHGFYFRVAAKGALAADTVLTSPRLMVTEQMAPGQTMQISWRAERPGNWLFHCHLIAHMRTRQRLDRMTDSASTLLLTGSFAGATAGGAAGLNGQDHVHASEMNHATDGMSGLIVGVRVQPSAAATPPVPETARRKLRLFANERGGVFEGGKPGYSFVLQTGAREPARDSVRMPGSLIVLRRGEPVEIKVFNRISSYLSVHWHGLELESFFDGVGDWSGSANRMARPVAPGDSFVVRLTPPRAGTFMYHVHGEEGEELASGLYGPLVVVDGPAMDTLTDKVILISDAGPLRDGQGAGVFVNGTLTSRLSLTAGVAHRLRLIMITGFASRNVSIRSGADTARWRLLALDGAELEFEHPQTPAVWQATPGTIADYQFTPSAGQFTLRVATGPNAGRPDSLFVPIDVAVRRR